MVSKARLDLPEPERPVITIRRSRGSSSETFFRLWTRAPCTAIVVRAAGLAAAVRVLPGIGWRAPTEKCEFVHVDVAPLGEPDGERRFADQPEVGQVFAGAGNAFDAEVALEVVFDFGGGAGFGDLLQVFENRS